MIHPHFDFTDQVVLITGAGRGIGGGIARRFAETGAQVALHYHTSSAGAERIAAEIDRNGGKACVFQADITDPDQVETLHTQTCRALGRLDVLVNNAGVYPSSPLLEMSPQEWEAVLASNLHSTFLCTQAAARCLTGQGRGGSIINIASIEGIFPALNHAHYSAAKAGVIQFTKNAARELAPFGIRVNAISPGLINRPGLERDWPEGIQRWRSSIPLTRLGEPQDIADACLFLASSFARWITGINLPVDGGASTTPAF